MVFEIEFVVKEKGEFRILHSAVTYADTVTDCRNEAEEIAKWLSNDNQGLSSIHVYIQDFMA